MNDTTTEYVLVETNLLVVGKGLFILASALIHV